MATPKRKARSKRLRFEIFKRDGFTCSYCGAHPPQIVLELDHIVALAEGGRDDEDNLTTACEPCNRGKGARSLESVPMALRDKAEAVAENEEQLRGYHAIMEQRSERLEEETWQIAEILQPGSSTAGFNRRYLFNIRGFLMRLCLHEVIEAAEIAYSSQAYSDRRRWLYFCGVCWRKIRGDTRGGRYEDRS